jgi:hypothetical protein
MVFGAANPMFNAVRHAENLSCDRMYEASSGAGSDTGHSDSSFDLANAWTA